MAEPKIIAVVGATGAQGGGLVRAIAKDTSGAFKARAITRDPKSEKARALAKLLDVPANRLTEIMRGTRDVTADTAIRLGRYFGTDPRFWLNLQAAHDISKAQTVHDYSKVGPRTAA